MKKLENNIDHFGRIMANSKWKQEEPKPPSMEDIILEIVRCEIQNQAKQ